MKSKKLLFVVAFAIFFGSQVFSQDTMNFPRQLGGDFSNLIYNGNNISVLYRKMETKNRSLRYTFSFLPSISYSQVSVPEELANTADNRFKNNKFNFTINPSFAVAFEHWKEVGNKFLVYYGPQVGASASIVKNYSNPTFNGTFASRSNRINSSFGVSVGALGGLAYKFTDRLMLSLEVSAGGRISYQNGKTTLYDQNIGFTEVSERDIKDVNVLFSTYTSIFRTLWLTYSF